MSTQTINIPCGHIGVCEHDTCHICNNTNDYTIDHPIEVYECAENGCNQNAISMFVPCGCVIFCRNHAEDYFSRQPCHPVLCPKFYKGECNNHIDTIVDIITINNDVFE